ncbi:ChaN family lipoprotein [Crenobacter sp. SG2303]|uniref:ChaN family lipoprotein n=1 Tax=Crenobacter oryzisoli TaxID=3056844 RepID=A0ABT7XQM1_9NEIS|nr:ChaN family lipoprotein [Crenobacter sp. SG2303]MDN0076098.1 ChaN family lipoprotein [Crenobacter sp. SG2303]
MTRSLTVLLATLALSACASKPVPPTLDQQFSRQPLVLLGEMHDNAEGHKQRYALIKEAVFNGWRPVIAMEQFDRGNQAKLDEALKRCTNTDCVIEAAAPANSGWNWEYYKPLIELAQRYKLPIIAANVSRDEAAKVMRDGFSAIFDQATLDGYGLNKPVPADILTAQAHELDAGHCGKLPKETLQGMVNAQIARDVFMAKVMFDNRAHSVLLIAGNGHVRRDIGVPRWLGKYANGALSVGFVDSKPAPKAFDRVVTVPATEHPNPCTALNKAAS